MNQKAIQDAYNLFAESGYKKSIDDFKSLIKTNPNALNDSYELFKGKGYSKDIESYKSLIGVSEPEKKSSVSIGTTPQEVSSTPLQGQSTTLGGEDKEKPKPLVTSNGETPKSYTNKIGEEIIYVNKDSKRGVVNEIPKDIPKGYSYKVVSNSEELRRWKEQQSKPKATTPKITSKEKAEFDEAFKSKPTTDFKSTGSQFSTVKGVLDVTPKATVSSSNKNISENKIIADNAFDYANKNASKDEANKRLEDEVNTKQFSDGVIQGLKNVYNLGIAAPLSVINTALGGNKDFTIKKSIPLEAESIQAKKELDEEFKGSSYNPSLIEERAKEIFIDNDILEQKHKLIDEALPSGYDREGVFKELKLEQLKSNDILRGAVASAEVWNGKIEKFTSFASKLDKDGNSVFDAGVTDQDIDTYEKLRVEAEESQKNLLTMSKNYKKYLDKAKNDEEKLELFKYNYNDWEKSLSNIVSGTKDIVAGSMKLGINTLFSEGPEGQPSLVRDISEISDEILSETEKDRGQFFRYKATSLNSWSDLPSFMTQLGSEQLPIVGSIILGGGTGVLLTSMSSGGQKIKELEDQAKQPGGIAYSNGKKLLAGWLFTGAEYWPQKFGTQRIIKDLGKTIASASTLSKRGLSNKLLKDLPKGIARGTYYSQLEGISERATVEGQIVVDEVLLGIVRTNAEKNEMKNESYLSGSLMGFGMNGVGGIIAFGVAQAKLYSDSKSVKEVKDLMDRINGLSSEVDSNPNLTKQEVTSIYTEMNRLNNIAYDIVSANAKKGIDLSIEAKGFLVDIDTRQAQLKDEFSNLPNSNFSQEYKDNRRKEITSEFDLLENKRQSIIGGGFNVLMTLNDKEVFNIKDKASRELLNEAKESGKENVKITEEQITKRAIENYEKQRKETTAKEPIEKRPTGEQKVETATTTEGQQDKVLQEAKDNVEVLRKEEIAEFEKEIENPQDFITDGKIDAKKVADSDNAKAKEIYAKYDAQIKPLLDNIKTQEDAIQKQSTNEGVLRPRQPEVGLQEVVEGDQKPEGVTEEGKEEIVPGSKAVVSGIEITYPTAEQETERKEARSKTEYVEEASKDLDVEDTTVMSKELEGDFGLLTAENPMAKPLTEAENVSLNKKAKQWLESRGYKPRRLTGKYAQAENSFFVPNLSKADAVAFAKEFNQDSVAHSEGLIYQDGSMNPRVESDDDFTFSKVYDANSDNVSVVRTKDGLKTFSVGYNFNERVQPKKAESKGREVSKNTDQAKTQLSNVADKRIAKAVFNGVKAIAKILPNVKVIIHDTDESFRSVSGESKNQESSGLYQNGEIHINLPKANARTVAHEIFHAILLDKVKTDANAQVVTKKMIQAIASKIEGNPALKAKLEDFASMYDENIQNEEKLAELVGMLAENYDSFSARVKEIIKNWLNNLAKTFGVELFETNEVFDVLNTIAKRVAAGKTIKESDISPLIEGVVGEISVPEKADKRKSIVGEIIRFDVNKNSMVEKDVPMSRFNGKKTNVFESDRMTGGYIAGKTGAVLFNFLGGVQFPVITGKWWASRTEEKAAGLAKNANANRDADGYIYGTPMVGSDKQHMSNNDMLVATVELMKLDANSKKTNINKLDVIRLINKAFEKKDIKLKKPILVNVTKKSNNTLDVFNELEFVLFQEGKYIVGRDNNPILDINGTKIPNLTFDDRKNIVETLLGNASVRDVNFPSAGNALDAAKRFEEPLTQKASKIGDAVTVMRTKGTLKLKKTETTDEFYHKSYPYEVYAENADGTQAEIEVFILDSAYSMRDIFPSLTKSSGESFTWDEYFKKHGPKSEKFAESQYNRTAKMSFASGEITAAEVQASTRNQLSPKVSSKLTEDGDGNFVFKHYSDERRGVIKKGQGQNRITSTEESSALSSVGGLAMFYTMANQAEAGVGNVEHTVLIPKDKVYDIDSDPLGFEAEARKRFNEVRPGQAFTNNYRGAFITKIANENGFDIAISQWRGAELRAQTTIELKPETTNTEFKERPLDTFKDGDYAIIDGRESIITNVDGDRLRYESIDGVAKGTTVNNEKNRRRIIKIDNPSVRMQKPKKLSTQIEKNKELKSDRKENMSSVLIPAPAIQVAVKAMREALKTAKNIGELIQAGVDALKGTDWYQKLDKKTKKSIEGELATSLSQYAFKEQQRKAIRDENRKIESKLKSNRKSAIANIKKGKFGSLTNTVKSNKETIVEHETKKVKVLNFAMLFPAIVKKAVSPILFEKYSRALSSLTGRGKAIDTKVSAQEVADLYDQIIEDYTNFAEIQNAELQIRSEIQNIIDNGDLDVLTPEQKVFYDNNKESFSETKVEKEEDRQELESETMDLIPSMRESAKSYDAKSMSFDIIKLFSTITPSDLKMLSNADLNNLKRVLETIALDEDIPSFANEAKQTIIANRNKALSYNISERYNKTGFNRIPLRRMATKITDSIRDILKKIPFVESSNLQSRASRFPLVFSDAANKIYGMLPQYVDAVQNNYKSIPIYNYIFSEIDKAEGAFMSRLEDVSEKFQKAEEKLFSKSKNIDESYRKIHFAFLQIQAWGNPGNKKVKNGIISFTENIDSDGSPYTDRERKQYKAFLDKYKDYQFIVSDNKVVVLDADGNDKTSTYFTKEELATYNSIRSELDIQKTRAEETSLFNNKNAMPFVNYYFPEGNFSKTASARPLSDDPLHNNFNKSSVKSKNLEEKTAVAHPVAHNPIAISLASIRSTEMQYQLLNPIQISRKTISGIIADNNRLFREATGKEKARLHELGKVYNNISESLDTLVEHLVNANAGRPDAMDNVFDLLTNTFYIGALASGVRTIADLSLNYQHLITAEPSALLSGISQRKTIKSIIKDNDIKDPNKFYRDILTYIDASQIARLMGVVNLTSVRSEFQAEGAGKNITRKDVESEASRAFRKVTNVLSPLATAAKTLNQALMSVSDNMPALNFYIGVFSSEFEKATGQEFDYEKAGNNDAYYMLENSDAILFSSMIANFKLSSYLGSKNISAKSPVVVSAMRGQSGNQLATKIYNRMNYLFRQFIMGSVTQFNTSLNNIVEAESLGDVSKQARIMLGSGLRTSLYQAFSTSMLIGLWGLIKGDDEDEEIIKDNSDKLSNDDDFVKELFTIGDEMKVLDESFEGVDKSDNVAFDEFMKKKSDIRDKVLSLLKKNSGFRDLFDANYRFFARELFTIKINNLSNNTKEMNDYGKSNIDSILDGIKNKKVIDIKVLENNLAFLHSERGRSLMIDDFRDDAVDKIEKHLRDREYYLLWDKSVPLDEFDATTPEGAFRSACLDITADNLLKHRDNSFLSNFEKGIVETSVNLGVGTRGSMPVKVASYGVELINRKSKEISRGYYDFDKDRYNYATPDIGLSDKKFDARKIFDTFGIPEITVLLKSIQRNGITDAALITFRVPGVSDMNRIKGTIRKDEIYNNTRGKFEENLFKEYLEKKLYMTKEEAEKKEEEEKKYNSRLIQDKDKIRLKE